MALKSKFKFKSDSSGEEFIFSEENNELFEETTDPEILNQLNAKNTEWVVYSFNPT